MGPTGRACSMRRAWSSGYCDLTQASIGAELGGQLYSEVICFDDSNSVDRFEQG